MTNQVCQAQKGGRGRSLLPHYIPRFPSISRRTALISSNTSSLTSTRHISCTAFSGQGRGAEMSWKGYPIRHSVGRPIKQPLWVLHLKGFGAFLFVTLLACIDNYPWLFPTHYPCEWFPSDYPIKRYYLDVALGIVIGIVVCGVSRLWLETFELSAS